MSHHRQRLLVLLGIVCVGSLACDGSDDGAVTRKKGEAKGGEGAGAQAGTNGSGVTGSGAAAGAGAGSSSGAGAGGSTAAAGNGGTSSSGGFSPTRSRVSVAYTPGQAPFPTDANAAFPGPGAVVSGCTSTIVGPCVLTDCPADAKPIGKGAQTLSTGDIEVSGHPENITITYVDDDAGYGTRLGVLGWKGGETIPFDSLGTLDLPPLHGAVVAPPLLVFAQPATIVGGTFAELDTSKPLVITWTGQADAAISAQFGIQFGGFVDAEITPQVLSCVLAGKNNTATIGTEILTLLRKEKSVNVEIASYSGSTTSVAGRVVDLALYGAPFRTFADVK